MDNDRKMDINDYYCLYGDLGKIEHIKLQQKK